MLEQLPYILAQDDEDWGKIIFGAVAALIWAVSAFVSWANKKTQEAKRRAQEEMMRRAAQQQQSTRPPPVPQAGRRISEGLATRHPEVMRPPAPPPRRPQQVRQMPPMPVQPMRPPPLPPKPKRRGKQVKAPMPPPMPVARAEQIDAAEILDETPVSRRETHQRKSAIAQMLTPRTLRNQFVLLEILQPPIALREDRQH